MSFASLTIDLNARIANIERDMGRAAHVAETQAKRMERAFGGVKTAAATLGVGLGVAAFTGFIKSSIDAADNINDLSQKIGVSVENLAGYKLAAEQSGTSLEGMGNAAKFLNKNIAENDPLLKKLGINATDANGAMVQLADVFNRIPDGAQKTAIAMQLMGKSGADMIPLLNGGGEALKGMIEQGQRLNPFTTEMARAADQFNDSLAVLQTQASGPGISLANNLLPALIAITEGFNNAAQSKASFLGGAALGVNIFNTAGQQLKDLREEIKSLEDQQETAIGLGFGRYKSIDNKIAQAKQLKAALEEVQRGEALALLDKTLAGGSKQNTLKLPGDLFGTSKSAKTAKDKLDIIDPFGPARRAAEDAALKATVDAQNAAFDDLAESRDYAIAQDEQAAAALGRMRDAQIAILDPVQQYRDKLDEVQTLLDSGLLTPDQAVAANLYWQEQIDGAAGFGEQLKQTKSEFDLFAEEALKGFQDGLADFLFDPFADGLEGMAQGFGNLLKRMAAEAIAADITRAIFGSGSAGGGGQNLLGAAAELFGFANGGSFMVGGSGGTDSQLVAFKASPNERVKIETPSQQRNNGGGQTINMTVVTKDAASFSKSRGQIQADLAMAVSAARRYS